MTANGDTDVYPGLPLYIIIGNFGKVYVHLSTHQIVDEVVNALVETVHIKDERYPHLPGAYASNRDGSLNAVLYKLTSDRLEHMTEQEAVMEKNDENLEKVWREDVQLPDKTLRSTAQPF